MFRKVKYVYLVDIGVVLSSTRQKSNYQLFGKKASVHTFMSGEDTYEIDESRHNGLLIRATLKIKNESRTEELLYNGVYLASFDD